MSSNAINLKTTILAKNNEEALSLLNINNIDLNIEEPNNTLLLLACQNNMPEVALKLIESGQSNPEQINNDGHTALMIACKNNMTEVVLKLIANGQAKPEQVNNVRNMSLITAYDNMMLSSTTPLSTNAVSLFPVNQVLSSNTPLSEAGVSSFPVNQILSSNTPTSLGNKSVNNTPKVNVDILTLTTPLSEVAVNPFPIALGNKSVNNTPKVNVDSAFTFDVESEDTTSNLNESEQSKVDQNNATDRNTALSLACNNNMCCSIS